MDIDDVISKIPLSIASFFEGIYFIDKDKKVYYKIEYNAIELKICKDKELDKLSEDLNTFENDSINEINTSTEFKKVFTTKDKKEKLVIKDNIDNYDVIYIVDITKKVNEDKKTILIADDSPVITKFFCKIFQEEFNIIVASNGEEAIKLIDENKNILVGIFLDLQMPIKNGYEVLDFLQQNMILGKIPVSIISGEETGEGIEKAMNYSGVIDMLQKPFSQEAARSIVEKTLRFSTKI